MENGLSHENEMAIKDYALNPCLGRNYSNIFGFLNDTAARYPQAISLVAGMPDESFFHAEEHSAAIEHFVDHMVTKTGNDHLSVINWIWQYNSSKGFICDIMAKYLLHDEGIRAKAEDILVTVGAQEAFTILVATLCADEKDVMLMETPGYAGLSSIAKILGKNVAGVRLGDDGIDLAALEATIEENMRSGRRVKLLYTIPDYQNPSGSCMSVENRRVLLELASRYNFLILEDSVYNSFSYAAARNPTLKSLDRESRVIYIGSFAKLLFPGLRIGIIHADQQIRAADGGLISLIGELEKVKGAITNNTPGITQAIVAGILIKENFSLQKINAAKIASYCKKRDAILIALDKFVTPYTSTWAEGISWNRPEGGFFIKIILPFELEPSDLLTCADKYGVLFCPMTYFSTDGTCKNEIRLAFSKPTPEELEEGVKRLAGFLESRTRELKMQQENFSNHQSTIIQ
jgi:DNA-binding transcriptional MocR family regulator